MATGSIPLNRRALAEPANVLAAMQLPGDWHLLLVKCSQCDTTERTEYPQVADNKDQDVDPIADDLGTLALDLMISETTDKQRSGVNFALFQGEG